MINNKLITLGFIILLLASCSPSTKEEALKKYKELFEGKTWCEIESKNKFLFEDGFCRQEVNHNLVIIGEYELDVEPKHGLTNKWYMPSRLMKIKTKLGNNYSLELNVGSGENLLTFENHKNKTILFLSDDCILSTSDSISYDVAIEYNYKMISLE